MTADENRRRPAELSVERQVFSVCRLALSSHSSFLWVILHNMKAAFVLLVALAVVALSEEQYVNINCGCQATNDGFYAITSAFQYANRVVDSFSCNFLLPQ